jgi:multiple sugar transport system permease protein
MAVLFFLFLNSFYIMLIGSFKNQTALVLIPPDINPFKNMLTVNFKYVFTKTDIFIWLKNSFVLSAGAAFFTVFVGAAAGYSFAKKKYPGRNALFAVVIATMILPKQMLLIPNYLVALNLGLTNKMIGVILTTVATPFGVFLCRQFMSTIPTELLEAAEIDGCGELRRFFEIAIPLSLPVLGALAIFSFLGSWNDYLWQIIMISDKNLLTIPIGIAKFAQQSYKQTGRQLAASTISTIPMMIIFFSCQKFFVKGITMGAVKG